MLDILESPRALDILESPRGTDYLGFVRHRGEPVVALADAVADVRAQIAALVDWRLWHEGLHE